MISGLCLILLVAGAVCFALGTFPTWVKRINIVSLGLLCWILVVLIHAAKAFH